MLDPPEREAGSQRSGRAATASGASIALVGTSKHYGSVVAVHPLDLEVRAGEFVTLLGPSGSGKTTTLNIIAGFTPVTQGDVEIGGARVTRVPAHRRGIGVVFQEYALFPHMTVEANISFPLKRRKISKDKRRRMVSDILETVRLEGYDARYPSELSGGQQQRVALARALVFQPDVLLMDEPLGALDRNLRDWLQSEIKRIHREIKTTVVYVTHDQDEALALSDRVAVFNHGRVEQIASPAVLYDGPESIFVGQFVGESTLLRGGVMNEGATSVLSYEGHILRVNGSLGGQTRGAILVRPESLSLRRPEDGPPASPNVIPVKVVERIYLGAEWKYEVRLPDGSLGLVREPSTEGPACAPGDAAVMTWGPEAGVLLPDRGEIEPAPHPVDEDAA